MRRAIRVAIVAALLVAVNGFLFPFTAQGEVRFEGRFRLPHGEIAVGVGDPYPYHRVDYGSPHFPVGSYVPYGYRVIRRPRLGYGFYSPGFRCRAHGAYHSHWIPARPYRSRYIVVERPYGRFDYHDRYDRRGYSGDPYYDFNREYWDR